MSAIPSFRLTTRAREASASPSVSLEKGRHRIRAPRLVNISEPTSTTSSRRSHSTSPGRNNEYLAILVLLLALACLASFGTAYYLYKARWSLSLVASFESADNITQAIEVDPHIDACPPAGLSHGRFLSYLPHSGFHNQRIALENALTLSRILNRTLLVPPARLGTKPLRYVNYDALYSFVALSGKENLKHCSKSSSHVPLPPECLDYFDYTILPWEWLVDFSSIHDRQPIIFRWNLTDAWLRDCLNLTSHNTRILKDSTRYHYRFADTNRSLAPNSKFAEDMDLSSLASVSEPLLQFGTLFGTSRLELAKSGNLHIRSQIRDSMALTNPYLSHVADLVARSLGVYVGVHIRLGDGDFLADGGKKARLAWWDLIHKLEYPVEDALQLEQDFAATDLGSPHSPFQQAVQRRRGQFHTESAPSPLRCRGTLHTLPQLLPLNVPLFIATDARDPATNPHLALFFHTFPCSFHLDDFLQQLTTLDQLVNSYDGLKLKPFLLPFLDAMIVGKAWRAAGTPGSTFSTYVRDILWPKYGNISGRG